jgi:heme-degrading monooxygenase HmoA
MNMVTIGMNYEVLEGKGPAFETAVTKVVHAMRKVEGHGETFLYRDVHNDRSYLIVSKWTDKNAFDAFIASDTFRKVADWGKEQILAGRPHHEVYGA